ncbi:helix-turn-helix domain-containing protein [Streptomyces asoensis]|uniref:transcriptional regulator n=1 Tax=Streptomyces asoensis TaxID=249586 RepID=UPI0033D2E678
MSTDDGTAEVTEFAALLTELKGRTERSYGSLARRLGMNTSTLHRYCAGEAVPQDFAPVERLAQFCGAGPEERLELHRRWLRAVAARRRPPATATPSEPSGRQGPLAAPLTPQATQPRQAPAAPEDGTPAPAPAPAPATEEATPVPAAEHATRSPSPASPEDVTPVSDAGTRGADAEPVRPLRRLPRRRTQVAVTVTCAVLATLGTLSALPGGGHPSASDVVVGTPTPSAVASEPARTTAGRLHGSPSPRTGPGTAAGSATASATGRPSGSSPAAGAPADGGTAPAPASGTPLTYTVDSQVWALGCAHDYVIDRQPAQVPPPPAQQDAGAWASAQGAVHGRETDVEITVQGRTSTAVVLTALRVRVVGRAAPLPGVVYAMEQGCGGDLTERYFAVDLDKDRPVARSVAGNDAGTPIPAVSLPYRVSSTDPEVLLVTARTATCACDWYLELDWSSQGRTGTVRVDDHGRPFRTSGIEGLPRYWYGNVDGARRWVPTG